MKQKNFEETVELPEGVTVSLAGATLTVKGEKGETSKEFKVPAFTYKVDGNKFVIMCEKFGALDKKNLNTIKAHIKNLAKGVTEGYTYKLKVCSSHFPMNVAVQGDKLVVKNLLGEKVPRELTLKKGPEVKVNGDVIEVTGLNKEEVGQVAADIEKLTIITNRDRRIFQDGIYITEKDGKVI